MMSLDFGECGRALDEFERVVEGLEPVGALDSATVVEESPIARLLQIPLCLIGRKWRDTAAAWCAGLLSESALAISVSFHHGSLPRGGCRLASDVGGELAVVQFTGSIVNWHRVAPPHYRSKAGAYHADRHRDPRRSTIEASKPPQCSRGHHCRWW